MEAMAERSLNGTVDLDYPASGLTWRLTCPAANALEPRAREQNSGERENRTDGSSGRVKVQTTVCTGRVLPTENSTIREIK
jgi:hypothetical protein